MVSAVLLSGVCFAADEGSGSSWQSQLGSPPSGNGQPPSKANGEALADLARAQDLHAQPGKEREALALAKPLIATFDASGDNDHLVDALFITGDCEYMLGAWADAESYMTRAADLGFKYFADTMSTYPLKVVGESQFEQKKYDEALATFTRRVDMLKKNDDEHALAGALFDQAGALLNLSREEEALALLAEAEKANNARAGELSKAGSGATPDEREGNVIDHAEIVYHMAIANYRLERYAATLPLLKQAYSFFKSLSPAELKDTQDRLVAVLDDLVLVSEKLGNTADAGKYRSERDSLNK
jgi:tetratricopeptide (TPR) repeat protein